MSLTRNEKLSKKILQWTKDEEIKWINCCSLNETLYYAEYDKLVIALSEEYYNFIDYKYLLGFIPKEIREIKQEIIATVYFVFKDELIYVATLRNQYIDETLMRLKNMHKLNEDEVEKIFDEILNED